VVPSSSSAAEPTYWQDVRPILRKNCTYCHTQRYVKEVDVSGGLTLHTYEAVLRWKEKNKALIEPGKSGDSVLYRVVVTSDIDKRMPLGGKALPAEAVAVLRRWIDSGAKEGTRPADVAVSPPVRAVRRRKLDVRIATTITPQAAAFAGLLRGPLVLSLRVGPLAPVVAVAFDPKGKYLAAGAYGRVTIWELAAARPVRVLTNVLGAVNDVRFSPDGRLLAVAGGQPSARGDLRLFRTEDWTLLRVLAGHDDVVNSVSFRHDGQHLASASYDRTARIWDVATGKTVRTLTMHSDFVLAVAFSPDGKRVHTGSKDRSVRMTEAGTGNSVFTFSDRNEDVLALAAHPDGRSIVSTGLEPGLSWWSTDSGARRRLVPGHKGAVHELAFSRDGKLLVSGGADGTVRLWNGSTTALVRTINVGALVYAVAISDDGKRVASGSFDGLVRVYDAGTGWLLATLLSLPPNGTTSDWLAVAATGQAACSDEVVKMGRWSMAGKEVPAAVVWKSVRDHEAVARSLRGETVTVPVFGK
jgi:DNA-binding beta-propeller fold protein YncE